MEAVRKEPERRCVLRLVTTVRLEQQERRDCRYPNCVEHEDQPSNAHGPRPMRGGPATRCKGRLQKGDPGTHVLVRARAELSRHFDAGC